MRRLALHTTLLAAALAVAGCGSGESKSQDAQVRATVTTYYQAFVSGDGAKACAELSSDTRAGFTKATHGRDCATSITQAAQRPAVKKYLAGIAKAKIQSVHASGNTATAVVQALGTTTTVPLVKEKGAWRIESALGG